MNNTVSFPSRFDAAADGHLTEALLDAHATINDALNRIESAILLGGTDVNRIRNMIRMRDDLAAQLAHIQQTVMRWTDEDGSNQGRLL